MLSNPLVRVVNNWLHDVGTGLWAACLLVLFALSGEREAIEAASAEAFAAMSGATEMVFLLLVGALVAITVTGALRLFYWRAQTPPQEMASKRPALIGKHVAFLVVYAPGTWWAWTLVWHAG